MKSKKAQKVFNILIIIFEVIVALAVLASFIYYGIFMFDAYRDSLKPPPEDATIYIEPLPIAFVFILIFSVISNAVVAVCALIPLILSLINIRSKARAVNLPVSITLFFSPFVLEGIILLFGLITGVIGK